MIRTRALLLAAAVLVTAGASAATAAPPSPTPGPTGSPAPLPTGTRAPEPASPAPSGSPGAVPVVPVLPNLAGLAGIASASATPAQYATFIKTAERQSGLIDILRKDDEVYLDLGPEQFDHPYVVAPVLASGVGQEAFAGRIFPTFLVEFKRVGKRVLWIVPNSSFTASAGTAAANALAISVTDSVINSTPIAAEDEAKKRVVISAGLFLTDFENVGRDLGGPASPILLLGLPQRPGYSVDSSRSYFERTKALPKNDEILASLAFSGSSSGTTLAAPDGRGVRLRMHYSIVEPPAPTGYVPRLADDRIGYFISAHKNFGDDTQLTPYVRYIDRWNFNAGPIVYYLTNEIPVQYKPAIRRALLSWNDAFAKAGIPNAVEVRDQPDDPAWDPDDVRYSTVRWITSDRPGFSAYGPHIADPRTGEIFRVEIVIDGEVMRSVKRGFVEQVVPSRSAVAARALALPSGVPPEAAPLLRAAALDAAPGANAADGDAADDALPCIESVGCDRFAWDSAELAATGTLALRSGGASTATTERYAEDWLRSVVLHEAGHNFGLRHNFAAAIYPLHELHDLTFTRTHGLVNSVMHYTPLNLSPPGSPQGEYFQLRLGPYDEYAIRYGYERFPGVRAPGDEAAALRRIADQSTRPSYAYATDEDANGPRAIDPHVATYLLSSDPFNFYRNQFAVAGDLVNRLDAIYPRDDRPYEDERQAFLSIMRTYQRSALLATRYIGGIYTSRAHRGQPGGTAPFRAIARDDQRRAFAILAENVFSSRALQFSPSLLDDLGPSNFLHRGTTEEVFTRPDFAVSDYVAGLQDAAMYQLFSPDVMSRIADQQLKTRPGATMSLADLFGWMQAAVWDDVQPNAAAVAPLHRALQRRYTTYLIAMSLAPSFLLETLGFPSDSASLARFELERANQRIGTALGSRRLDVATRAHLEDLRTRVGHALDPGSTRGS